MLPDPNILTIKDDQNIHCTQTHKCTALIIQNDIKYTKNTE